jgi:hypothetical protein
MCSHIFEAFPAQTLLLPIVYEAFPAQPIHLLPESAGFSFFRPFLHSRYSYFAISCQLRLFLQKTFLTLHCTNSTPHHQQKLLHKHDVTIQDASQQLRHPKNKLHITYFLHHTFLRLRWLLFLRKLPERQIPAGSQYLFSRPPLLSFC